MPIISISSNIIQADKWPWGFALPVSSYDSWSAAEIGDYSDNWSAPHRGKSGLKGPDDILIAATDGTNSQWLVAGNCVDGWRWPNVTESQAMHEYRAALGLSSTGYYWTSVEVSTNNAYAFIFFAGYTSPHSQLKTSSHQIRCVRSPDV